MVTADTRSLDASQPAVVIKEQFGVRIPDGERPGQVLADVRVQGCFCHDSCSPTLCWKHSFTQGPPEAAVGLIVGKRC